MPQLQQKKRELKSVIIQYLKIFRYTVRSANGK